MGRFAHWRSALHASIHQADRSGFAPTDDRLQPPEAAAPSACTEARLVSGPPSGYLRHDKAVLQGICEANAAAEGFYLSFTLKGRHAEDAVKAALKIDGPAKPTRVDVFPGADTTSVHVFFGAGPAGEQFTVRLAGALGVGGANVDMGYRLKRYPSPQITVELDKGDGVWGQLEPGATLPRRPLALRFTLPPGVNGQLMEQSVRDAFAPGKDDTVITPVQTEWDSTGRLVVRLPEPPPRIQIYISPLPGEHGVDTKAVYFSMYTGTAPALVAYDPASGTEQALGAAPADIAERHASPDGRWVLLNALKGDSTFAMEVWLLDTRTGALRKTAMKPAWHYGPYYWQGNRLVTPAGDVQVYDLTTHSLSTYESKAAVWGALSPDGRYLAGFDWDGKREDPQTWIAPATIYVHDLMSHKEQAFTDLATIRVPHNSSPPSLPMRWSGDGKRILFQDARRTSDQQWQQMDLASGKVSAAASAPPAQQPPAPGPMNAGGVYFTPGWGPVKLHFPGGKIVEAGDGFPVGWTPDGKLLLIRWSNYQRMRHPGI